MALKRTNNMMAAFSMASMTDVIFLLLIFFMVTSTFVFPTALEVNLPESSRQTALKPSLRIFIDADDHIFFSRAGEEPLPVMWDEAPALMGEIAASIADTDAAGSDFIAVYADESVTYGTLVRLLDIGAAHNLKMILATKPAPASARPEDVATD